MKSAGQLYAYALRSSVAAGAITQIDVAVAAAVSQVVAIYTHQNAPAALGWHRSDELLALSGEGLGLSALRSSGAPKPDGYLPLTSPEIHFAGQWVAVIVAESIEAAQEALGLIRVAYAPAPAAIERQPDEPAIRPGFFFGAENEPAIRPGFFLWGGDAGRPRISAFAGGRRYHPVGTLHDADAAPSADGVFGDNRSLYWR